MLKTPKVILLIPLESPGPHSAVSGGLAVPGIEPRTSNLYKNALIFLAGYTTTGVLRFATMWMEVEGVLLCEVSLKEKEMYQMISCMFSILRNKVN